KSSQALFGFVLLIAYSCGVTCKGPRHHPQLRSRANRYKSLWSTTLSGRSVGSVHDLHHRFGVAQRCERLCASATFSKHTLHEQRVIHVGFYPDTETSGAGGEVIPVTNLDPVGA